jgi:hypothetical protein
MDYQLTSAISGTTKPIESKALLPQKVTGSSAVDTNYDATSRN